MFDFRIERMEPERLLTIRWRPDADAPPGDLSPEKTTLAVFQLEAVEGGTLLHFSESGYDKVPPERRAEVFRGNSEGWDMQMKNIAEHVTAG